MGVVIFTALLAEDENTRALCYRALELFAVWPLLTTGLVCLASGTVLDIAAPPEFSPTCASCGSDLYIWKAALAASRWSIPLPPEP